MVSLTLTIFMISNFAVVESNAIPALVFDTLGYYPMYAISMSMWIGMFFWLRFLERRTPSNMILVKGGVVIGALVITSVDLLHNIRILSLVI